MELLQLGIMWRAEHPPDYLDFTKEDVQSEARAGVSGKANQEVKLMNSPLTLAKQSDVNGIFSFVSTMRAE